MNLLIATTNKGKQHELRVLLEPLIAQTPLKLVTPDMVSLGAVEVEETGETFQANAELKGIAFAKASGLYTLADDSGLLVDALDGRPGIYTARYGGPGLDNAGRRRKLLEELHDVPLEQRGARFECVITLVDPETLTCISVTGVCAGRIAFADAGEYGFGYDPIFIPEGYDQTFAQLDDSAQSIKNQISHRGRAVQQIAPFLRQLAQL